MPVQIATPEMLRWLFLGDDMTCGMCRTDDAWQVGLCTSYPQIAALVTVSWLFLMPDALASGTAMLPHQYCNLWIACKLACTQPKTAMHPHVMHIPQVHGFPELQVSISPNKVTCCHALGKAGYCCYRLQHQRRPVWAVSGAGHGQLEHSQHCLASSGYAHPTASWHHTAPGNTLDLG